MSVYFARVGRYIKVGFSENPERRVANLFKSATRYNSPRDIDLSAPRELIGSVPGDMTSEWLAHRALRDFLVFCEWFVDEPEVRDYIGGCLAAGSVQARYVSRPGGEYVVTDAQRGITSEDREFESRAASNIFAHTSLGASP